MEVDYDNFQCSIKKKREKEIEKLRQRGLLDRDRADPFALFMGTKKITHCLYNKSDTILGNTFGMCILQVSCTSYYSSISLFFGFPS
jgi:tRNA(Met) C34 N-acetyltransferase TmcA